MNSQDDDINRREFVAGTIGLGAVMSFPILTHGSPTDGQNVQDATPPTFVPQKINAQFNINGKNYNLVIDPRETVLDVLRERLELTGTKKGCDHGQCGACTIHVDGKRVNACLSLAAQNQKKEIITIEGLAKGDDLHPMQDAFIRHDAFQCGFCTPGQIMSAVVLEKEKCGSSEAEVRECMSGNLCRCGAYRNILDAIMETRSKSKKGDKYAAL